MRTLLLSILGLLIMTSMRSDLPAYVIYNSKGKATDFEKLVKEASEADVVLFGELHNSPVCHWLELELTRSLYQIKGKQLILAAEMFETDNALIISEYLNGKIKDKSFETEARLWPNYKTDYKPLLQFARDSSLMFIPTNIPRRYAALVNRDGFEGLDSLSSGAKYLIAPLPIDYDPELPGYKSMIEMMGENGGDHVNDNLPKAQAAKDATMAYNIARHAEKGKTLMHFHGTYHSDNYEGIVWYLKKLKPELKILTINTSEQDEVDPLATENEGIADFIIIVPSSMTKTY